MDKKRKSAVRIVKFRSEDAEKLAELFNSFDREGLWPGGFTKGVPFTAERVLTSFPAGVKNICVLISTYEGVFTGVCSLHPHFEDSDAAYIGVFGVHPDFLGKKHGKALILRAIQIAAEKGFRRVDLNTWAGNMRAVPLYKKAGMFWVPETSVTMQDFVPGIIRFPLAREFFKGHDWYSSQVRRLDLVPDEFKLKEMEVYPYEFAEGKDHLKVWVDRYGRSITGIESILDDERQRILCRLEDPKVIAGVENKLIMEILNGTKNEIHGSVFLSGFEGLDFISHPRESFKIEKGKSLKLEAKFLVRPETEVPDVSRKQKTIKASLTVNDELMPFEVGIRVLPLLEFEAFPETMTLTPGTAGKMQINLFNNSRELFKGNVFVIDENDRLSLDETAIRMSIPSKSHSGFSMDIRIPEDQPSSAIPLRLFAKGEIRGVPVETRTETVFVKCLRLGGIVSSAEKRGQERFVVVENEDLVANLQLRGALLNIVYKNGLRGRQDVLLRGGFGVGPPFGFAKPVDYEYEILRKPESLELVLIGLHPDKPGIKMIRDLTFYGGTSLIREQIKIVNMNADVAYDISVRISGISPTDNMFRMVVPLKDTVEHEMISFPSSESDLPTDPNDYGESWVCFQSQAQGFSFGQAWSREKLSKVRFTEQMLFAPEYSLGKVKPGQTACTSESYYIIEPGNWQAIRRKWQSLIERKMHDEEAVESKPLFNVRLAESALYDTAELKTRLEVINLRNREATGRILPIPPKGWKIVPSEICVTGVKADSPFSADVSLYPPSKPELGVHSGSIEFHTDRQLIRFPLDVVLLSKTSKHRVSTLRDREEGKEVVKVSNGLLKFKASAEFAGCLYFLSGEDEVNHLSSSFPRIETKVFLQNYSGGVRALYLGEGFDFQKSKSHLESYETEIIKEERWKGVKFSFESEKQEQLKGILGSISYLTLPSSNIVKIKREFKNATSARFEFDSYLWISPNVGGDLQKNEVIFSRDDRIFRFKRAAGFVISGVQPEKGWVLVANAERKAGLGVITGDPLKSLLLSIDIGTSLMELMIQSKIQLQPTESCQLEDYIVLCNEDYESMDRLSNILRKTTQRASTCNHIAVQSRKAS
jgi:ribosomal protein S18 acetylase RimI-like enzyme